MRFRGLGWLIVALGISSEWAEGQSIGIGEGSRVEFELRRWRPNFISELKVWRRLNLHERGSRFDRPTGLRIQGFSAFRTLGQDPWWCDDVQVRHLQDYRARHYI